jgi:GH25 family lysozyme M1 (1,4-beta-N-acetylmuramidase)
MFRVAYKSPAFNAQYEGATKAGLIRGAYHFARPDSSSGAVQAEYFAKNGGGWSGDGITLPGALDMECKGHLSSTFRARPLTPTICWTDGPDGDSCYGLSASAMVNWIRDFSNTYHAQVKRYPVIYTSTSWWQLCTGNNGGFGTDNPLWIARYASSPGALPAGWKYHTFWQYSDKSSNPGDPDVFNGDEAGLKR